jgi:phosphoribosylformimino-5-aminoimidazole carboxamide ribotide isomerase
VTIQIGGGIRTTEAAQTLLALGASKVVVGTRAITDPEWFYDLVRSNRNKIILAVDTKDGKIQLKGWKESSDSKLRETLRATEGLPLAGVLHTNVNVEGKAKGIDLEETKRFVEMCPHDVIISGGITTVDDLASLETVGVRSTVVGLALYKGTIRPEEVWK